MRAFGYMRISKLDDKTTSPARQRQEIERLCEARGWELVKVFEDLDISGYKKNGKRPGLDGMLGRLGEVEAIVFWKADRLARGVIAFNEIIQRCEAANVALVCTSEPFDMTSPHGRAMVQITAVFAELESRTISERAKSMHVYLKENGRWVGRVPYGWRLQDGKLVPHDKEQAVLVDVARRYVAGESLRSISTDLGLYHANLARTLRTERVLDALPDQVSAALVSALSERGREGTKAKRSLLGGIARCAICSAGMTVVGRTMGNGSKKPRGSYVCRERGHVSISRPWLDEYVSEQALAAIDTGTLLMRMEKRKRPRKAMASSEIEARLELLERDFYEGGLLSRESYLRRREGLLKRLSETRTAQEDAGIDLPRELAANLSTEWETLSLHGQRRIIGAVLQRVEVSKSPNHGRIEPTRVELVWR
jgi:DNA invertase Pin-like site-specific DNA recombinase